MGFGIAVESHGQQFATLVIAFGEDKVTFLHQ